MHQGLIVREWAAVFALLIVLITLTVSSFSIKRGQLFESLPMISVQAVGAVKEPQQLLLPEGSLIVDALTQVMLAENADVRKLALHAKLQADQLLVIPTKGKTTIFVTGAIEESGLTLVPDDCRYPNLIEHLSLREDADLKQFKRKRRLLREGEVINILSKK